MTNREKKMPTLEMIVEEQERLFAEAHHNENLCMTQELILVGNGDGSWFMEKYLKQTFKSLTITDLAGVKCFFETIANGEMVATTVYPVTRDDGTEYYSIYTKNKSGYLSYNVPSFPGLDDFLDFYKTDLPRVKADFELLYNKLYN